MKLRTMLITALLAGVLLGSVMVSCAGPAHSYDGERLGDCPDSPNCACSEMNPGDRAYVPPLRIAEGVDPEEAFEAAVGLVAERATIERRDGLYVHAVFRTRWLRFKDDLELRLDPEAGVIHVRSASRVGHSDFGANANRVAQLVSGLASLGVLTPPEPTAMEEVRPVDDG